MRVLIVAVVALVVAFGAVLATSTAEADGGLTPDRLANAGFFCMEPEPNEPHCIPSGGSVIGNPVFQILVFHGDEFMGTETLVRKDIFAGQECPTDVWLDIEALTGGALPYWGCHHFAFSAGP